MTTRCSVACYYFPNYHVDPHNERQHGPGWTEWELVKRAEPRFPGHRQPCVPLWGYEDESDPAVMARKIDAAADHGIDAFLFDWYWFEEGPFLERGLDRGFLKAPNRQRMKFALMWANENWVDGHPTKLGVERPVLFHGEIKPATWDAIMDAAIERYFRQPNYWTIDGRPYFSFFELMPFIRSFGSLEGAREAIRRFRERTRAAGFPGLHLNAVEWALRLLPAGIADRAALVRALGFDSVTAYCWVHHVGLPDFPANDYRRVLREAVNYWPRASEQLPVPYHPNVTMGWDPSVRTCQSDIYENRGHPFGPIVVGNTPEAFAEGLRAARDFVANRPASQRIVTLNAWNEWTEGSYLEPDTVHGTAYLEAVKAVFG